LPLFFFPESKKALLKAQISPNLKGGCGLFIDS
jgi:hypothetical protein